ncbi:MAG: tape measure protein, partial [Acinetobacter sp.]
SNKEMQNMAVYGVYNLKQVSRGTEGFGQSLLKLTNRIIAATVVYKAFTGLLAGITGFVKSTIDTAVYFEKMQSSMTAVTGSYKAAEVEIAYLTETSKKFGISVEEIGAAYVKLSAAARGTTFSLEDVHRVFEATVVSGRVLNLTGLEMKGMLYALQQMISKGKVSMEELRLQLGDRLPGAMGLAAAAMEMPVSQLEKLISTGQVKSIDFLKKFSDYILTEFSPGMTVASTTIEFARGRFQNFYTDMKKTFGTGMKTQYAETLDLFTVGLANMSDEAERTGVSIGNMWSNFNDFLVKVVSGAWYENQVIYFAALKEQFNDLLATAGTSTSGMGDIVDSFL